MTRPLLPAFRRVTAAFMLCKVSRPDVAADADALQTRYAELNVAQAEVDRLYARWAELEAKMK